MAWFLLGGCGASRMLAVKMKWFSRNNGEIPHEAAARNGRGVATGKVKGWRMRLVVVMAVLVPFAGETKAFEAGDADTIFNSFRTAFYVGTTRSAYIKETTDGGRAWFWTQANMIEMVADTYDRTGSTTHRNMLSGLCRGFMEYHGQDWAWNEYNDDVMWACIVFFKAYLATGDATFRQVAKANFDMVWQRGWSNDLGGGMWWRTDNQTKNACNNCPAAIVACQIYEITGDASYLTKARQAMAWMNAKLVTADGAINDHMNRDGSVVTWIFSYNQGTYVGASNYLYKLTGDPAYLRDALKATRYMRDRVCDANGIFPDHGGGDGAGFNGVGVRWMTKFVRDQELWAEFYPWLKKNADAAWNVRRADNLSWQNWKSATAAGRRYAFECYGSVTALQVVPASNPAEAGWFANVPETAAENYQVLYEFDLPADGGFRGSVAVPYAMNRAFGAEKFDRVAYYLELKKTDGATQWVYASMDAFTDDPVKLGLPHSTANPVVFQQPVKSLNVFSNVAGVATGSFQEGGNIEMWPGNYDPGNAAGIHGASGATFDWGDANGSANAGYGSFQVHNAFARQPVFAYNHWGESGANDDLGIGGQPEGNPDWTLAANAGDYTSRKLVILIRPKTPRVTLAEFPKNGALHPRDIATNKALVAISGTVDAEGHSKAVLRVSRGGSLVATLEQPLSYPQAGGAPFAFAPEITAEPASYDFELAVVENGRETRVRRATDIVAGDVYLFYGQSNMEAGRGFSAGNQSAAAYTSPFVRTFGQNADSGAATRNNLFWVQADGDGAGSGFADPGAVGQWAIVVGRKILDDHGIPVALLNGARGDYSMAQLRKDDANPDALDDSGQTTRTYNRMRFRARQAGIAAKARAMFFYQGEAQEDDAVSYAAGWEDLWNDWKIDYPALEHFYQVQVRPGCGVSVGNVALRQIQRQIGDSYPDTSVTTGNGLDAHDGCHYAFTGGYESLGLLHYRLLARDLYGAIAAPDIDALNPAVVEFTDATRRFIRVEMRDAAATIDFPAGALADFAITGAPGAIVGRAVSGNVITFELDQPAIGAAVLEYRGHFGQGEWVTNGNGVGLLAFAEPVGPFGPLVTLSEPASTFESAVGVPVPVRATAAAGPNGGAVKMTLFANGVPQFEIDGGHLETTWTPRAAGAYRLSVVAIDASGVEGSATVAVLAGADAAPGGVGDGLTVWLRAESGVVKDASGAVSQWLDRSGNGHHVSQATAFHQPRHEEGAFGTGPGIAFDGSDFLTAAAGMPTGDYTKVVRFKAASASFPNNLVSSPTADSAGGDHALWVPELRPSIYHSDQRVTAAAIPANAATVLIATYDAALNLARLYVDGVLAASGTMEKDNAISSFQLGAFAGGNHLYGVISEVMIYDRVLGDTDRAAVSAYLDDRLRTPYQLWQAANTIGDAGGPPDADDDGDGFPNVLEYAFGMDPAAPDASLAGGPFIAIAGDEAIVTYRRPLDRPDVIVRLENSPDLIDWSVVADEPAGAEAGQEIRRHAAPLSGENAGFYRLKVWRP